ncbi:hypothetical protein HPB50_029419 [Hyalomma asiaticum]|nr:hypothetical protein HPB50_029419 [Hyalomma asiaticum]
MCGASVQTCAFSSAPLSHPCVRIAANPRVQGLRERVQRSILRAANVTRSRQGITNGMNEIIGPIYYTLVSDPNPEWRSE